MVASYLKKVTALEDMIAGGLYTACGQVPRIRELLTLEVENGPSTTRGIFLWNGSVIYLLRHHKAKRSTNREFYVARFLPARLGMVMVRYLACIRRLAQLLRREQHGYHRQDQLSHDTHVLLSSNGKTWASSHITSVLKAATACVWEMELNVQQYRQVTVGITEKHVREVHQPFNRYDDHSIDADINVSFAWQSGHRPIQRAISYGLDGAFPHQLQPALLRAHEWASTRWHQFIHQPSKKTEVAVRSDQPTSTLKKKQRCKMSVQSLVAHKNTDQQNMAPPLLPIQSNTTTQECGSVKLNQLLSITHNCRILICLICRSAIRPNKSIERYFRSMHRSKGETLRQIRIFCSSWSFDDPTTTPLPKDYSKAIPELPVLRGLRCSYCRYLTISRRNLTKHFQDIEHKEMKKNDTDWEPVLLQTFLKLWPWRLPLSS